MGGPVIACRQSGSFDGGCFVLGSSIIEEPEIEAAVACM
jgi:hypothetical protein